MISLTLHSICREFRLNESPDIFDSITISPGGEIFKFVRHIPVSDRWQDSKNVLNEVQEIGTGEDPRAFLWKGVPCISTIVYSYEHGYFNRLYHTKLSRWFNLIPPKEVKSGKNWSPFTIGEDLYFVHEFTPFRIFKARPLNSQHDNFLFFDTVAEFPVPVVPSVDGYATLRGGSNGLLIKDSIFGFGHTNEFIGDKRFENIIHRPFLWEIKTGMEFRALTYPSITNPFDGSYMIVDPTSLFFENNSLYLITCETEYPWNVTRDQRGRICKYEVSNLLD